MSANHTGHTATVLDAEGALWHEAEPLPSLKVALPS